MCVLVLQAALIILWYDKRAWLEETLINNKIGFILKIAQNIPIVDSNVDWKEIDVWTAKPKKN